MQEKLPHYELSEDQDSAFSFIHLWRPMWPAAVSHSRHEIC